MKPGRHDKVYGIADSAGRSLIRLFSAVILARICGPSVYPVYVICIACETFATSLANAYHLAPMLSIGPGLACHERDAYLRRTLVRHCSWSIGLAGLGALAAFALTDVGLGVVFWCVFAAFLAISGVLHAVRAVMQARFESRMVFWVDFVGMGAALIPVLVLVGEPPSLVLTTYFAGTAFAFIVAALWCLRSVRLTDSGRAAEVSVETLGRARMMAGPMVVGSVATTFCSRIQPFVLQASAGSVAVGAFGAAGTTIGPVRMLAMAISNVARPRFALLASEGRAGETKRVLFQVGLFFGAVAVAAVACSLWFGEALIVVVFGPEFRSVGAALPLAFVYACLEAGGATTVIATQVLMANGAAVATKLRISVSFLSLLIVWPACFYGGTVGAFAALCLTELLFVGMIVGAMMRAVPAYQARLA